MIHREVAAGDQLDAVQRAVTAGDGQETIETGVSLSQSYATDVDDLWNACSTGERLARWFAPVSGELELGGRLRIEGNAAGTIQTIPAHVARAARQRTTAFYLGIEPGGEPA